MSRTDTCRICGSIIETTVPAEWHPTKLERLAEWAMEEHVLAHASAEVARQELRERLDETPTDERQNQVRELYRQLLGRVEDGHLVLNDQDGRGVYAIDEVLGLASVYRLWQSATRCWAPRCACRQDGALVGAR